MNDDYTRFHLTSGAKMARQVVLENINDHWSLCIVDEDTPVKERWFYPGLTLKKEFKRKMAKKLMGAALEMEAIAHELRCYAYEHGLIDEPGSNDD